MGSRPLKVVSALPVDVQETAIPYSALRHSCGGWVGTAVVPHGSLLSPPSCTIRYPVPPGPFPSNCAHVCASFSRWTDDILEGFLYSTLIDGSGLVLDKLGSDGKGKKSGVSNIKHEKITNDACCVFLGAGAQTGTILAS